jgi:hypothetical protein
VSPGLTSGWSRSGASSALIKSVMIQYLEKQADVQVKAARRPPSLNRGAL